MGWKPVCYCEHEIWLENVDILENVDTCYKLKVEGAEDQYAIVNIKYDYSLRHAQNLS